MMGSVGLCKALDFDSQTEEKTVESLGRGVTSDNIQGHQERVMRYESILAL